jgi:hypothetical protein
MSDTPNDDPKKSAERVVGHNEKFNVTVQTEKEEAQFLKMHHQNLELMTRISVARSKALIN